MKKCSPECRQRICRLIHYRQKRFFKKKRKIKLEQKIRLEQYNMGIDRITAPKIFSLFGKENTSFLNFIQKLNLVAGKKNIVKLQIDFSQTRRMVADGTLYFLASLETLIRQHTRLRFVLKRPKDKIVWQVLQQVGIAALCGVRSRINTENFHKSVKYWYAASGYKVNAEDAQSIYDSFEGKLTNELQKSIYTGITEAMTNCCHHAYEAQGLPDEYQKWWMFSREYEQELQVLFCDLGIGIPKSLFNTQNTSENWIEILKNWLQKQRQNGKIVDDALKIKAAIEIGKSRTKQKNRGKGLKQMVNTLNRLANGEAVVRIYSGNGLYSCRHIKNKPQEFSMAFCEKTGIKGTMIYWQIPLPCETHKDSIQ